MRMGTSVALMAASALVLLETVTSYGPTHPCIIVIATRCAPAGFLPGRR
ncbi:hypothetical protein FBY14_11353 [Azospirillum brasilense]|nr:hypothetical protein FBY14_11353 [Azospirillum brasilense]